jgi:hypothetical protein
VPILRARVYQCATWYVDLPSYRYDCTAEYEYCCRLPAAAACCQMLGLLAAAGSIRPQLAAALLLLLRARACLIADRTMNALYSRLPRHACAPLPRVWR